MSDHRFAFTGPHLSVAPIATGFDAFVPGSNPLRLGIHDLPAECSVREPGVIMGCRGVISARNNDPVARYRWDATGNTVRCLHCGADVTAATTVNVWREMLSPAVPALPSPNARANELRPAVAARFAYARELLAARRPKEAEGQLRYAADLVLDAIAAGCDDPAGLARDLAVLRDEVRAAQR